MAGRTTRSGSVGLQRSQSTLRRGSTMKLKEPEIEAYDKSPEVKALIEEQLQKDPALKKENIEFTPDILEECVRIAQSCKFKSGVPIISHGDTDARFFYILEQGTVDVLVPMAVTEDLGKDQKDKKFAFTTVASKEGPDSFGGVALVFDTPRTATILAVTDCLCWTIDRASFKRILDTAAQLQMEMMIQGVAKKGNLNRSQTSGDLKDSIEALKQLGIDESRIYMIQKAAALRRAPVDDNIKASALQWHQQEYDKDTFCGLLDQSSFTGRTRLVGVVEALDFDIIDLFDREARELQKSAQELARDRFLMRPIVLRRRSFHAQQLLKMAGIRMEGGVSPLTDEEADLYIKEPGERFRAALQLPCTDYIDGGFNDNAPVVFWTLMLLVSSLTGYPSTVLLISAVFFVLLGTEYMAVTSFFFRYHKRMVTIPLRFFVNLSLIAEAAYYYDYDLGVRGDMVPVLSMVAVLLIGGVDHILDLGDLALKSNAAYYEVKREYPGRVFLCTKKKFLTGRSVRTSHRVETELSGEQNNLQRDKYYLLAYVEGLIVELVHVRQQELELLHEKQRATKRRSSLYCTSTFDKVNPNALAFGPLDAPRHTMQRGFMSAVNMNSTTQSGGTVSSDQSVAHFKPGQAELRRMVTSGAS